MRADKSALNLLLNLCLTVKINIFQRGIKMFEKFRKFETTLAGRPLVIETGKMAGLANGACLVRYGETEVLCTATMSAKPREGVDFFPLSVDYEEKLYSVGKIPGSFQRR